MASAPRISVSNDSATEGSTLSFRVSLSAKADRDVTIFFATYPISANANGDSDYRGTVSSSITIKKGKTSGTIDIRTNEDDKPEADETFELRLSNPSYGTIDDGRATGTIRNDDVAPRISIANDSATEGQPLSFRVTLDQAADRDITLDYATYIGTANRDGDRDYVGTTGNQLVIRRGARSGTIEIRTTDDDKPEEDETFEVRLGNPSYGTIDDGRATGTIRNDDVAPRISIANAGATEGQPLSFRVTLDRAADRDITLDYATYIGTANRDGDRDYAGTTGSQLVIRRGARSGTIEVRSHADDTVEDDETFEVRLGGASYGTIDDGRATGTIRNNDVAPPPPEIRIGNASATEGETLVFAVTLDRPADRDIILEYATYIGSANRDGDKDYAGTLSSTITIRRGARGGTIEVKSNPDDRVENDEAFQVRLLDANHGRITGDRGTGTIRNDDVAVALPPKASIANASAMEGGVLEFAVTLDRPADRDITFEYATYIGTANRDGDRDYRGTTSSSTTIRRGASTGTIRVESIPDNRPEDDELFEVRLIRPSYGTLAKPGVSGISCVSGHDGKEGAPPWPDGKNL